MRAPRSRLTSPRDSSSRDFFHPRDHFRPSCHAPFRRRRCTSRYARLQCVRDTRIRDSLYLSLSLRVSRKFRALHRADIESFSINSRSIAVSSQFFDRNQPTATMTMTMTDDDNNDIESRIAKERGARGREGRAHARLARKLLPSKRVAYSTLENAQDDPIVRGVGGNFSRRQPGHL